MEIISLEDILDVYNSIGLELFQLENEKDYIAVYGKRDLICELFEMMIADGYSFRYADCDFMDEMLKDRVYMMFVRQDCGISIEPAYGEKGKPIIHDAKTAFIFMDDCKQDVIDYCVKSDKNVVLFDYEDDCCCNECQCACKEESKISTTPTAVYKVNGKEVDKDIYDKVLKDFNNKYDEIGKNYLDNLIDMSNRYNNWINSVIKLHRFFY
jgi:hypothetical protein